MARTCRRRNNGSLCPDYCLVDSLNRRLQVGLLTNGISAGIGKIETKEGGCRL